MNTTPLDSPWIPIRENNRNRCEAAFAWMDARNPGSRGIDYCGGHFPEEATHFIPLSSLVNTSDLPPPPPQEKTQLQEDDGAFQAFIESNKRSPFLMCHDAWYTALAYRDAQNRGDLENLAEWPDSFAVHPHAEALARLRKRAGLPTQL